MLVSITVSAIEDVLAYVEQRIHTLTGSLK